MLYTTRPDMPKMNRFMEYMEIVWKNRWLTNEGILHNQFLTKLREFLGMKHICLTSNGTVALQLALRGLKLSGEIITTPFTFIATSNVLLWDNITPVFADINFSTFNIDPVSIEKRITNNTQAILATHVFGNPCDLEALEAIGKKYNIPIIYDAAHCFGVEHEGKTIFSYGDISATSFHATKVFHTVEGGAIFTNNSGMYNILSSMINHGFVNTPDDQILGINGKMNEIQAAFGLCNLDDFDEHIINRKKIYNKYMEGLKTKVKFQQIQASKYNYSYMPILFDHNEKRDRLFKKFKSLEIDTKTYFYPLIPDYNFIKERIGQHGPLPVAKDISERILCLPMYSSLSDLDINKIIDIILSSV